VVIVIEYATHPDIALMAVKAENVLSDTVPQSQFSWRRSRESLVVSAASQRQPPQGWMRHEASTH
jgi:hypothetical protein